MVSLWCKMGLHKRSRGRARREGAAWVSRCRRCGVPMRRAEYGKWHVVRPDPGEEAVSDPREGDQPSA